MRLKYLFAGEDDTDKYNKKLYIKSKWKPPLANEKIEKMLDNFEWKMREERNLAEQRLKKSTNLTAIQEQLLQEL